MANTTEPERDTLLVGWAVVVRDPESGDPVGMAVTNEAGELHLSDLPFPAQPATFSLAAGPLDEPARQALEVRVGRAEP